MFDTFLIFFYMFLHIFENHKKHKNRKNHKNHIMLLLFVPFVLGNDTHGRYDGRLAEEALGFFKRVEAEEVTFAEVIVDYSCCLVISIYEVICYHIFIGVKIIWVLNISIFEFGEQIIIIFCSTIDHF